MARHLPDIALVVAWREGEGFQFAVVDTAREVTEFLRDLTDEAEERLESMQARPYSVESELEEGEYFVASLENREEETDLRDEIVNVEAMGQLLSRDLPEKPLTFYAVIVGNDPAERIAYLRKTNPMQIAKAGNALFEFGDTLSVIENPVFVVQDRFDLILHRDEIAILNAKAFSMLFYDLTGVDAKIGRWLRKVSRTLPMLDSTLQLLTEGCRTNARLRRRLQAIEERGHLAHITMARFKRELERLRYPADRFIKAGKIAADKRDHLLLLQILNEDLFRGGLSDEDFAAERKIRVIPT